MPGPDSLVVHRNPANLPNPGVCPPVTPHVPGYRAILTGSIPLIDAEAVRLLRTSTFVAVQLPDSNHHAAVATEKNICLLRARLVHMVYGRFLFRKVRSSRYIAGSL